MNTLSKDNRTIKWSEMEKQIQDNAKEKDASFVLSGSWKTFLKEENGYKVFSVDGKWIRRNLCAYFGHGGHGLVHEFIPINEIWISSHHYHESDQSSLFNCGCSTKTKNQKCSEAYFESTMLHEITECEEMKKGKSYWEGHNLALEAEKKAGLIPDPFSDN